MGLISPIFFYPYIINYNKTTIRIYTMVLPNIDRNKYLKKLLHISDIIYTFVLSIYPIDLPTL